MASKPDLLRGGLPAGLPGLPGGLGGPGGNAMMQQAEVSGLGRSIKGHVALSVRTRGSADDDEQSWHDAAGSVAMFMCPTPE